MKAFLPAVSAALLLAGGASAQTAPAQTPPARPASDLTRDLNSGPPTIDEYLAQPTTPAGAAATPPSRPVAPGSATTPAPARPTTTPPVATAPTPGASRPATAPAAATPPRPATAAPSTAASSTTAPARTAPPVTTPAPSASATRPAPPPAASTPAPAVTRPAAPAASAPATVPAAAPTTASAAPAVTVLDAAARAALPFAIDLPPGFEMVTGRPGPDFKIYTVRRGQTSFAMIYAGPASQFPIYSGEMVEAGGRASVVATEGQARHAMEHLFQRQTAPREIHVWTMSLEGADRALAERIAQSVDPR